jgi:hypothetical protein
VRRHAQLSIVIGLCGAVAVSFFAYKKIHKHSVVLHASGSTCHGSITVEEQVLADGKVIEKASHEIGDSVGTAVQNDWKSPERRYPAGTVHSVLIRSEGCEALGCWIEVDGQVQGKNDQKGKEQVSCSVVVGN